MTHIEIAEEILLLGLLCAFALLYVWQRAELRAYRKHAKRTLADLHALEERLRDSNGILTSGDNAEIASRLRRLESSLTRSSRKLLKWRSDEVERWIIGKHIDLLLIDYERAGAMTTRLLALLAQRPVIAQSVTRTNVAAASAAS